MDLVNFMKQQQEFLGESWNGKPPERNEKRRDSQSHPNQLALGLEKMDLNIKETKVKPESKLERRRSKEKNINYQQYQNKHPYQAQQQQQQQQQQPLQHQPQSQPQPQNFINRQDMYIHNEEDPQFIQQSSQYNQQLLLQQQLQLQQNNEHVQQQQYQQYQQFQAQQQQQQLEQQNQLQQYDQQQLEQQFDQQYDQQFDQQFRYNQQQQQKQLQETPDTYQLELYDEEDTFPDFIPQLPHNQTYHHSHSHSHSTTSSQSPQSPQSPLTTQDVVYPRKRSLPIAPSEPLYTKFPSSLSDPEGLSSYDRDLSIVNERRHSGSQARSRSRSRSPMPTITKQQQRFPPKRRFSLTNTSAYLNNHHQIYPPQNDDGRSTPPQNYPINNINSNLPTNMNPMNNMSNVNINSNNMNNINPVNNNPLNNINHVNNLNLMNMNNNNNGNTNNLNYNHYQKNHPRNSTNYYQKTQRRASLPELSNSYNPFNRIARSVSNNDFHAKDNILSSHSSLTSLPTVIDIEENTHDNNNNHPFINEITDYPSIETIKEVPTFETLGEIDSSSSGTDFDQFDNFSLLTPLSDIGLQYSELREHSDLFDTSFPSM